MKHTYGYSFIEEFELKRDQKRFIMEQKEQNKRRRN